MAFRELASRARPSLRFSGGLRSVARGVGSASLHWPLAMPEQADTTPTGIKAPHGADSMEIAWGDGVTLRYPHRVLRGFCPCAGCQGHSGGIRFQGGNNLELREL